MLKIFTIAGPGSATLAAGSSADLALSITPLNGFSGTILLSCAGFPSGDTCTLPGSISPQNVTPLPVTIAIAPAPLLAVMPLAWFGFLLFGGARLRKKIALLAVLASGLTLISGCGGAMSSGSSFSSPSSASPSQFFTATVTATSGSISHQFQIAITVEE